MPQIIHRVGFAIVSSALSCGLGSCVSQTAPVSASLTSTAFALDEAEFALSSIEGVGTSRDDLFKLSDALKAAYKAAELTPPFPLIRIVDAGHDRLQGSAIATAMVGASGQEFIYFNRRAVKHALSLEPIVFHEVAHLKAWRIHGHTIDPHGAEYKSVCWSMTSRYHCTAKEPRPIKRR